MVDGIFSEEFEGVVGLISLENPYGALGEGKAEFVCFGINQLDLVGCFQLFLSVTARRNGNKIVFP